PERGAHRGAFDDCNGRRNEPLVPLRRDLPEFPGTAATVWLPGRQRWWVGSLCRPGESAPTHRLANPRVRCRLGQTHAAHGGDAALVFGNGPVALRELHNGCTDEPARERFVGGPIAGRLSRAGSTPRLDTVTPRVRPESTRHRRRGGTARAYCFRIRSELAAR